MIAMRIITRLYSKTGATERGRCPVALCDHSSASEQGESAIGCGRDSSSYSYRGKSTWQQVKDAVRDAWDRVTGR
jgi:hypothetical protein